MTLILISPGRVLMTLFYYYYGNVVAIYDYFGSLYSMEFSFLARIFLSI